jgi:hypothetical protein
MLSGRTMRMVAVSPSRLNSPPSRNSALPTPRDASLDSPENCKILISGLLETDPAELGRYDLALLNLLCAPSLPGSENLDIPRCLARLDNLTAFVKASTERNLHRFRDDPDWGHCEPMWRMSMLVTLVKRDFGAAYDPDVWGDLEAKRYSPFVDSRNVFIHGLLADDPKPPLGMLLVHPSARRGGRPPIGLSGWVGRLRGTLLRAVGQRRGVLLQRRGEQPGRDDR